LRLTVSQLLKNKRSKNASKRNEKWETTSGNSPLCSKKYHLEHGGTTLEGNKQKKLSKPK
jgi:hypothetical protein